jgi:hypothetical protein
MHDGISFDKILPKQVGYFGTKINRKQTFGHNARSATLRFSFVGSGFSFSHSAEFSQLVLLLFRLVYVAR